ncbi:uncharacterized protein LOC108667577 [Hyalella azteca]|uniref:non-specific serine/threonine protein kinase n=1 Tax=Hyalella azteca TaxID=294128 RepID=A0A8B7N9Q8_HYAAZ|nr:uncharacterized protein LOC108667577 [Hyalella azteca]
MARGTRKQSTKCKKDGSVKTTSQSCSGPSLQYKGKNKQNDGQDTAKKTKVRRQPPKRFSDLFIGVKENEPSLFDDLFMDVKDAARQASRPPLAPLAGSSILGNSNSFMANDTFDYLLKNNRNQLCAPVRDLNGGTSHSINETSSVRSELTSSDNAGPLYVSLALCSSDLYDNPDKTKALTPFRSKKPSAAVRVPNVAGKNYAQKANKKKKCNGVKASIKKPQVPKCTTGQNDSVVQESKNVSLTPYSVAHNGASFDCKTPNLPMRYRQTQRTLRTHCQGSSSAKRNIGGVLASQRCRRRMATESKTADRANDQLVELRLIQRVIDASPQLNSAHGNHDNNISGNGNDRPEEQKSCFQTEKKSLIKQGMPHPVCYRNIITDPSCSPDFFRNRLTSTPSISHGKLSRTGLRKKITPVASRITPSKLSPVLRETSFDDIVFQDSTLSESPLFVQDDVNKKKINLSIEEVTNNLALANISMPFNPPGKPNRSGTASDIQICSPLIAIPNKSNKQNCAASMTNEPKRLIENGAKADSHLENVELSACTDEDTEPEAISLFLRSTRRRRNPTITIDAFIPPINVSNVNNRTNDKQCSMKKSLLVVDGNPQNFHEHELRSSFYCDALRCSAPSPVLTRRQKQARISMLPSFNVETSFVFSSRRRRRRDIRSLIPADVLGKAMPLVNITCQEKGAVSAVCPDTAIESSLNKQDVGDIKCAIDLELKTTGYSETTNCLSNSHRESHCEPLVENSASHHASSCEVISPLPVQMEATEISFRSAHVIQNSVSEGQKVNASLDRNFPVSVNTHLCRSQEPCSSKADSPIRAIVSSASSLKVQQESESYVNDCLVLDRIKHLNLDHQTSFSEQENALVLHENRRSLTAMPGDGDVAQPELAGGLVPAKRGKGWRRSLFIQDRFSDCIPRTSMGASCQSQMYERRSDASVMRNRRSSLCMSSVIPATAATTDVCQRVLDETGADDLLPVFEDDREAAYSMTAKERVLELCGQTDVVPITRCFTPSVMRDLKKIGEGAYGEVFMSVQEGRRKVFKIMPIEGNFRVNDEVQKTFDEIFSEILISIKLSELRMQGHHDSCSCFVHVLRCWCVQGSYTPRMIALWDKFDQEKQSENDRPDMYPRDQLHVVLEFGHAGQDLESYVFSDAAQALALFWQVTYGLAVAEKRFEFEHRDLHFGNILVEATTDTSCSCTFEGEQIMLPTHGVRATIIDFTMSRLRHSESSVVFNDLCKDPDVFKGEGDYQFDIYRAMRDVVGENWNKFEPKTNVMWLHYLLDKLISECYYRSKTSRRHRLHIAKLEKLKSIVLKFDSSCHLARSLKEKW